jgi:CubicO group peptidase (beta-lactamase class C family)
MFRQTCLARGLAVLTLMAAFLTSIPALAAPPDTVAPRKDYARIAAVLEKFIQREMKDKGLPSLSIALVDDQQVVWARGFGFADPDKNIPATANTVYRIGSVSKLFTDIGIMQMVEKGKINIDAPVSTYIPEFKPANQFDKPITLRQLMSHRSGLLRESPIGHYFDPTEPTLKATVLSMNALPLVYPPETRVKYSNVGIATVGYVLERMNNERFPAYLKKAVLVPMGMESSAFEPEPKLMKNLAKAYIWTYDGRKFAAPKFQLGTAPAGSMYSTVNDLGMFMSALFADGRGRKGQVLKPESLKEMFTPQFPNAGGPRNFGLGFVLNQIDGHRLVGHGGAVYGFATEIQILPDDKIGAVTVTTMDSANSAASHIASQALRLMLALKAGKDLPEIAAPQPIPSEQVSALAGYYGEGDKALELIPRGNDLYAYFVNGGYEMRLKKLGNDLIVDDRIAYGLKFTPTAAGVIVNGKTFKHVETPKPQPVPEDWKGLVGEYGWDHDILYIFPRNGKLTCLIEWYEYEPLEQISNDVFRYPTRGLYDKEDFVFTRDANGQATEVKVGGVLFKRRNGPATIPATFRLDP